MRIHEAGSAASSPRRRARRGETEPTRAGGAQTSAAARALPTHDPRALGRLLQSLEPRLTAVALRLTRDRETAEDVVQSAFEKVLRHGHRFRGDSRVSTWLHRIVTNEALMWLRVQGRRASVTRGLDETDAEAFADPQPDAEAQLARRQRLGRLRDAIAKLPPDERDVLVRCGLRELSYGEAAAEIGVHPHALKSRAFRARRRLGVALAAEAAG